MDRRRFLRIALAGAPLSAIFGVPASGAAKRGPHVVVAHEPARWTCSDESRMVREAILKDLRGNRPIIQWGRKL